MKICEVCKEKFEPTVSFQKYCSKVICKTELARTKAFLKFRFEIFKRDNFTCQYCGEKAPNTKLQVDHIIPRAKGGTDKSGNFITACQNCNLGKCDILLTDKELEEAKEIAKNQEYLDRLFSK